MNQVPGLGTSAQQRNVRWRCKKKLAKRTLATNDHAMLKEIASARTQETDVNVVLALSIRNSCYTGFHPSGAVLCDMTPGQHIRHVANQHPRPHPLNITKPTRHVRNTSKSAVKCMGASQPPCNIFHLHFINLCASMSPTFPAISALLDSVCKGLITSAEKKKPPDAESQHSEPVLLPRWHRGCLHPWHHHGRPWTVNSLLSAELKGASCCTDADCKGSSVDWVRLNSFDFEISRHGQRGIPSKSVRMFRLTGFA